jgi:hypothetical protein
MVVSLHRGQEIGGGLVHGLGQNHNLGSMIDQYGLAGFFLVLGQMIFE